MSRKVRVSTISLFLPDGVTRLDENVDRAVSAVKKALEHKPDIICLPECYTILYSPKDDIEKSLKKSVEINGRMSQLARKGRCYIISNILERIGEIVYNSAFIINRSGEVIGKYTKTHLAAFEEELYGNRSGNELPVFETDFGRIAVMICMDIHMVEVARVYGVKGAEILFWPTQAYGPSADLLITLLRSRAFDNQMYCVASNFSKIPYHPGKEIGHACIIGLDGSVLADTGTRPGIATVDIDLDELNRLDWGYTESSDILSNKYPDWRRLICGLRRPELYKTLSEKNRELQL